MLNTDQKLSPFYTWTRALPDRPGRMLRSEPLDKALMIEGAAGAFRILHSSIDGLSGTRMIFVSGAVYLPQGQKPDKGWPVMAWCHGTRGVADQCAPSWSPRAEHIRLFLSRWLKNGFAVVASDYQGLGTPGPHPYLLFRPEGNSTLDGLRAALSQWPELGSEIVLVGQSQGGGAALGAAWLAPDHAPELNIAGAVATGAVADFEDRAGAMELPTPHEPDEYPNAAAYEALFLLGTMRALHPALAVEEYVTEPGYALLAVAASQCFAEVKAKAQELNLTPAKFYKRPIDHLTGAYEAASKIPDARFAAPVFIGAGLGDEAVIPARQFNNVAAMCASGTKVEAHFYPDQSHESTVNHSFEDALEFARRMVAGGASRSNCDSLPDYARTLEGG